MKFTKATKSRLVKGVRLGMTIKQACSYANIAESTYFMWMQKARAGDEKYLDLLESLKKAEAMNAADCLEIIMGAAKDGSWQAAMCVMERRHGWVRNQPPPPPQEIDTTELVDPTTEEGREAIVSQVAELPEELILAALNRRGAQ